MLDSNAQMGAGTAGEFADLGAQTMATTASLGEVNTIAAAQTVNGLSTLLVSEGLARLIRNLLGGGSGEPPAASPAASPVAAPAQAHAAAPALPAAEGVAQAPAAAEPSPSRADLVGMSTQALGELLTRTVANRIVDLNTVNTYLGLATSEQLRQWGRDMATGSTTGASGPGATGSLGPGPKPDGSAVPQWVAPGYPPPATQFYPQAGPFGAPGYVPGPWGYPSAWRRPGYPPAPWVYPPGPPGQPPGYYARY